MKERRKKQLSGKELANAIEEACDGLIYVSETDAPIELIFIPNHDSLKLFEGVQAALNDKKNIKEEPAAKFFDRLTAEREWHGPREKAKVKRFVKLEKLLKEHLTDLTLFRAGRVRLEVVAAGFDSEGNVAGIRTKAVET